MSKRLPETNLLISYLKACAEKNRLATYEGMSKSVKEDIHKRRYCLNTAIAVMQREYGYVATCIHTVGYQFLKNVGVADKIGSDFQSKVKNCVRRAENGLATVEWKQLSSEELKKAISCSIKIQSHRQLITPSFLAASDKVAANSDRFIDSAKAAANLMKNIG